MLFIVYLTIAWYENNVRSSFATKRGIALDCAGIFFEVLVWSKLNLVHENTDDYRALGLSKSSSALDQGSVSFVQASHCRHEHDGISQEAGGLGLLLKKPVGANDFQ